MDRERRRERRRYDVMRKKANEAFDEIEEKIRQKRLEMQAAINAEQEKTVKELERRRAAIQITTENVENAVNSASDVELMRMFGSLKAQLDDLEAQEAAAPKVVIKDMAPDPEVVEQIKAEIAAIGEMTTAAVAAAGETSRSTSSRRRRRNRRRNNNNGNNNGNNNNTDNTNNENSSQ